MSPSEAVGDGVVVLTPFAEADAPAMRDGDRDPELRRRFGFPPDFVPSIEHSLSVVARWKREREALTRLTFAVRDAADGTLLGGCELRPLASGAAGLSYWTYPPHRRRSFVSRAAALAIRHAFADLGLRRIEVLVDADNEHSRRVALHNGFEERGTRGEQVLYILDRGATLEPG